MIIEVTKQNENYNKLFMLCRHKIEDHNGLEDKLVISDQKQIFRKSIGLLNESFINQQITSIP